MTNEMWLLLIIGRTRRSNVIYLSACPIEWWVNITDMNDGPGWGDLIHHILLSVFCCKVDAISSTLGLCHKYVIAIGFGLLIWYSYCTSIIVWRGQHGKPRAGYVTENSIYKATWSLPARVWDGLDYFKLNPSNRHGEDDKRNVIAVDYRTYTKV